MDACALEISNVSKTFFKDDREDSRKGLNRLFAFLSGRKKKTTVVDSVDLCLPRGVIYGVLGPNGSGKSTLIRMVATLLLPDKGSIRVFGFDVVESPMDVQRMINRVSVDAAFFRKLSALENLIYAGRLYGINAGDSVKRSKEILAKLGFDDKKLDVSMSELSRGMQQKVAIARGFLTSPILLLLDEPSTSLDPKSKRDVQEFIRKLRDEHDATILLTTHDMAEAEALCDRIAILHKGKVVAFDTAEGLRKSCQENGNTPTLEECFIKLTGEEFEKNGEENG